MFGEEIERRDIEKIKLAIRSPYGGGGRGKGEVTEGVLSL